MGREGWESEAFISSSWSLRRPLPEHILICTQSSVPSSSGGFIIAGVGNEHEWHSGKIKVLFGFFTNVAKRSCDTEHKKALMLELFWLPAIMMPHFADSTGREHSLLNLFSTNLRFGQLLQMFSRSADNKRPRSATPETKIYLWRKSANTYPRMMVFSYWIRIFSIPPDPT